MQSIVMINSSHHTCQMTTTHQILFRILAKGVTPIPAPTSMATSNLNTSSDALPYDPSIITLGNEFFKSGVMDISTPDAVLRTSLLRLFSSSKLQPNLLANSLVKSPTTLMCTER